MLRNLGSLFQTRRTSRKRDLLIRQYRYLVTERPGAMETIAAKVEYGLLDADLPLHFPFMTEVGVPILRRLLIQRLFGTITQKASSNIKTTAAQGLEQFTPQFVAPLPPILLSAIEDQGLKIDQIRSRLLFLKFSLLEYGRLVLRFCAVILRHLQSRGRHEQSSQLCADVLFLGLSPNELPFADRKADWPDLISWAQNRFSAREGCRPDTVLVCADSPLGRSGEYNKKNGWGVTDRPHPSLAPLDFWAWTVRSLAKIAVAPVLFMFGRWEVIWLLDEILLDDYFARLPKQKIAKHYLFNSGCRWLRPLWTYRAEKSGAAVGVVHYSANEFAIVPGQGVYPQRGMGEKLMSWPLHYVLCEENRDALMQHYLDGRWTVPEIVIDHEIDWSGAPFTESTELPRPIVAVFDVPQYREEVLVEGHVYSPYYANDMQQHFLRDLVAVARNLGIYLAVKPKKRTKGKLHPGYLDCLTALVDSGWVLSIDGDVSARALIQETDAVISLAFSSPTILALGEGKPGCFYDPTGFVASTKPTFGGAPVFSDQKGLEAWLEGVVRSCR